MRNLTSIETARFPTFIIRVGIAAAILIALTTAAIFPVTASADSLDEPGISIPRYQGNGVAMFWHTKDRGDAEAPDGWKVERRHRASGDWVVSTFILKGKDADALQTHGHRYWDWVDTTAHPDVSYTYRVRAINADGSDMAGRTWSRRAPVEK